MPTHTMRGEMGSDRHGRVGSSMAKPRNAEVKHARRGRDPYHFLPPASPDRNSAQLRPRTTPGDQDVIVRYGPGPGR
jgi:hypothetical protein